MTVSLNRTVLLYILLIVAVRLMGKRQVAEMEPAEFVVTMLLADLASVPMQDNGLPLLSGLVPIFTILGLELIVAVLTARFVPLRRVLCGRPSILIRNGSIDQRAMETSRVSAEELFQRLREKDVFDLRAVKYAILETDGELSVLPYPKYQSVTAGDLSLPGGKAELPFPLISGGVILPHNLKDAGYDKTWLDRELRSRGLREKDVYLMTVDRAGTVLVIRKEKR